MRLSAVIVSRNDNYGGHLNSRATFCLNSMLDSFDEVIYVDWNSPEGKGPLTDDIEIVVNPERLKTIVVTPDDAKRLLGDAYAQSQKCCESLGRNIGIRRATGDYIVSTNIDNICARRSYIEEAISQIPRDSMATITRSGVPLDFVQKVKSQFGTHQATRDMVTLIAGVGSIRQSAMFHSNSVTKEILESCPKESWFNVGSVIGNCGDFQIAHRDVWHSIRGFEESQTRRLFSDTLVQIKVIMNGGSVVALNLPPVYHIDHDKDPSHTLNEKKFYTKTENPETWGFSNENFEIRTLTPK